MTENNGGLRLGFIAAARTTFDMPLASETTQRARRALESAGFVLLGPAEMASTPEEAAGAIQEIAAQSPDCVVLFQATFADSTMAQAVARGSDVPLVLWAVPEQPTGGRLRLNSYCGVNLAAHALRRAGLPYEPIYSSPDDPAVPARLREVAKAGRIIRRLQGGRIGRVGTNPDGFDSCLTDAGLLNDRLGVEVIQFELDTIFAEVKRLGQADIGPVREELSQRISGLAEMDRAATDKTLGSYLVLRRLAEQNRLDGFAVRCWPQFFTELGCAACGALSLLSEELIPASCECDVNGVITQLILQAVAEDPVFDTDIVAVDEENDAVVFWHCGKAPLSMADPAETALATVHSNRQMPLLLEFPLKPGPVTICRLSAATGDFRLVLGRGEMIRAEKSFGGTSGRCRFEKPAKEFMERMLGHGLEHHVALAYGDSLSTLRTLARWLQLPVLEL
mgnify:CR=1 FL=1